MLHIYDYWTHTSDHYIVRKNRPQTDRKKKYEVEIMITKRKWKGGFTYRLKFYHKGKVVVSSTFDKLSDAKAYESRLKFERDTAVARDGFWVTPAVEVENEDVGMSVAEALDKYVQVISPTKKDGENAVNIEGSTVNMIKKFALAKMNLEDVKPKDMATFRDERLAGLAKKKGQDAVKPVKPATCEKATKLISHLFTIARREWGFENLMNPCADLRFPTYNNSRDRRLDKSENEYERLMAAAKKYGGIMLDLIEFSIQTGCRRSEALNLVKKDISIEHGTVTFEFTKNRDDRVIPLSTKAFEIVKRRHEELTHREGKMFPMTRRAATKAFQRITERACLINGLHSAKDPSGRLEKCDCNGALVNLRLHDMRHEATSRLAENPRLNVLQISAITGHKDLKMLQRYTHLNVQDIKKLLD